MLSKQHERSFRTFLKAARMQGQPWISLVDATTPSGISSPVICILGEDNAESVLVPYALALSPLTRPILSSLTYPPHLSPLIFRGPPTAHNQ
jgi:hypothetical protein